MTLEKLPNCFVLSNYFVFKARTSFVLLKVNHFINATAKTNAAESTDKSLYWTYFGHKGDNRRFKCIAYITV